MSEETLPIELLEAQRLIRAKQVNVVPVPGKPVETLDESLGNLLKTIKTKALQPDGTADLRERQVTIEKLRSEWNAPKRHVTRVKFDPVPEWCACLDKIREKIGSGFTAALVGKRGPGKTQIAVELMRSSTEHLRSAYYCTAMDYFMRIKDAFHTDRKERQEDAQKFFVRFKLLVIDECNVRSDSSWEDNMLADLIGKRYNGLTDTILISNETASEFEQSMGPSVIDRLNETGGVCECRWKSFRE